LIANRSGEAQELASRVKRIDDQIADLRRGIEEDIQEALLNLESAAEQVAVAKEGQDLAQRELELSRDRFQAGTTNNVEWSLLRTSLRAHRRTTFLPSPATRTRSLRWLGPWGIRENNFGKYMGNP